jgi:hypothetical protein
MGTSVEMAGGSLAEPNYWWCAGSRVRLMIAPHVQVMDSSIAWLAGPIQTFALSLREYFKVVVV